MTTRTPLSAYDVTGRYRFPSPADLAILGADEMPLRDAVRT